MFVLQIIYENSEFILKWYFNTKKKKPQLKEMKKLPKNGEQKITPCFFFKKKKIKSKNIF